MKTNKKITAGKAPTDDLTVRAANISLVIGDTDDHGESETPLDVSMPVRLDEGWYVMSLDHVDDEATFSVDSFSLEAKGDYQRLPDEGWVWVDGTAQSSFYLARSKTTTAAFKIKNTRGGRWAGRAILSGPYPYDPLASSSSPKSSSSHGSHGHSSGPGHSSGFSSSSGKPESSSHSPSSSPGSSSKSSSHSPSSSPGSSSSSGHRPGSSSSSGHKPGSSSGHKPGSSSSPGHKPGSSSSPGHKPGSSSSSSSSSESSSSESSSSESSSSESSSSSSESSSSESSSSSSESSSSESSSSSCCCRCHGCGVLLGTNGGVLVEGNALVLCTEGCSSMSGSSSYDYVCVEFDSSSDSFDDSLSFEPLDFTESSDI